MPGPWVCSHLEQRVSKWFFLCWLLARSFSTPLFALLCCPCLRSHHLATTCPRKGLACVDSGTNQETSFRPPRHRGCSAEAFGLHLLQDRATFWRVWMVGIGDVSGQPSPAPSHPHPQGDTCKGPVTWKEMLDTRGSHSFTQQTSVEYLPWARILCQTYAHPWGVPSTGAKRQVGLKVLRTEELLVWASHLRLKPGLLLLRASLSLFVKEGALPRRPLRDLGPGAVQQGPCSNLPAASSAVKWEGAQSPATCLDYFKAHT
ncbi:uncharacterized protein LOC131836781 isoform X22 [Mustela lutreola]|uniref:uncharacterized protein LOC131836781 isoform X22 n=1 Tax=Mustela lutreola TaxID=9666 RepID=UPI002796F856|nr:uncharacterized protein LOC131836781 isoform X22 [Mustela lutreola]